MEWALAWFDSTHVVRSTGFGAHWELVGLPEPGAIGDQDAWLWNALAWLRSVYDAMVNEAVKTRKSESKAER